MYTAKPVDPKSGPVTLTLTSRRSSLVCRGRVLDEKGQPVAHALVEPYAFGQDNWVRFGGLAEFEPLALTNDKGEFRLAIPRKNITLFVQVSAPGFARRNFRRLSVDRAHDLTITPGVTVTGRVVKNGRPVAAVTIGLVQQNRISETFLGDSSTAPNEKGVFTFLNVPPNEAFTVYGRMESLRSRGTVPVRKLRTGADGTRLDVGDLTVVPGHRLSGKLVLSDGKPIPPGTRVLVSREEAWDTQQAVVGVDGSFLFKDLPPERYSLSARLRGYHVSPKNASFDALTGGIALVGTVRANIAGLRLLYEPGDTPVVPQLDSRQLPALERRRDGPLRGAPR